MEIDKAIEILSDCCDRGMTTFDDDFREAVRMGKSALVGIRRIPGVKWDGPAVAALADITRFIRVRERGRVNDLCCQTPSCGGIVRVTSCERCGPDCKGCTPFMGPPGSP